MKKQQSTPEKYKYMIVMLANKYHMKTGIELRELIAEATLAFLEACHSFDTSKHSKLSTYTYACINNHLINFMVREMRWRNPGLDAIDALMISTNPTPFFEIFEQLPRDCQEITQMIFQTPEKYASIPPKVARGKVVKDLRTKGWSWPRIWDSIRNFKSALNEIPENCIIY